MSGMTKTLERKKSPLLFLMLKGEGHGGIDVGQILRLDLRITLGGITENKMDSRLLPAGMTTIEGCPIEHIGQYVVSDEQIFEGGQGTKPSNFPHPASP
jgi:hypothetical protein